MVKSAGCFRHVWLKPHALTWRYAFLNLDESKRMLLAKASIINTFQTITECGAAWLWPADKIMDHILEVEGLELLQRAQAAGKGTVVLAPHLGNWEVFGLYLNTCGCGQSSQLYQAPKSKASG